MPKLLAMPTAQSSKPYAGVLLLVLVVVFAGWMLWSKFHQHKREQEASQAAAETQRQATATAVKQYVQEQLHLLATRTNGVLDWQDASQDYTVDVQETMIRRDERPIVFAAYIQDIRATQEGYTLLLTPFAPHTLLNPPLLSWVVYTYYWLTCDRSLGETIRAHTRTAKQRDYFAVTARITALERPWFAVQDDTVQPTKGRTIIAHGHLLDMVPLEKQPARTPALSPHVPCSGLPLDEEMACEMTRARTPSRP